MFPNFPRWVYKTLTSKEDSFPNMIPKKFNLFFIIPVLFGIEIKAQCVPGASRDPTTNCVVFDGLHLKNFDGSVLSYNSQCGYTLVSINSRGTNLEINLRQSAQTLQVIYAEHTYDIKVSDTGIELIRDGNTQTIPHFLYGVSITKPGSMLIVEIKDLGLKIRYDGKTAEIIQNNQLNTLPMRGMCGNNDGCSGNDLVMKNGATTTSSVQFANSWSIGGCSTNTFLNSCGTNSRLKAQATAFCNSLFGNQKFSSCGAYTSQFMDICTSNYCNCKLANRNDCMCEMLDAYVRTCQMKNNELISWRSSSLCPINCRILDQEYMTCAPNKKQLSCGEEEIDTTNLDCEEGCYCPTGLRLYQDKCLFADECPCIYENVEYKPGSSIAQECNTCTCNKGAWSCTNKICKVDAECNCDPHYRTFDGKLYDFMGKCMYYVVRGNGFDVICDHYIWNGGAYVKDIQSTGPTYCAKMIVQVRDDVIELENGPKAVVNGYRLNRLPFNSPSFRVYQESSEVLTVSLKNNVDISFNGQSRALVKIPTTMIGRVKGLFGTYTKTQDDDFLMANGSLTSDPNLFGHSWKVPGSCENEYTGPVHHPCSIRPEKKEKAEKACAALKSGLFADCPEDLETNYENCVYDVCECPDEHITCACEFYVSQAAKCAAKGKPVDWRKEKPECAIKCPAGQTYQTCGNPCTRSCEDIGANPTCEASCVEGCNCPEGQTLNEKNQCIPINKCTCTWEEARYNPDFTFIDNDNKCTCTNAKWNITDATPDDKTKYPTLDKLKEQCNADEFLAYTGCKRVNTITCQNKHLDEDPNYDNCQSGCQCQEGFVFDTELNMCVRPEDCPCMYNGISYLDNSKRNDRNQTCVCKDGFWTCTPSMDHWEKCSVWNNIHVRTFDELIYSFRGNCDYTLFEHNLSPTGVFRVSITTVACNIGSCITSARIYYKDTTGREDIVTFTNGQEFRQPGQLANLVITDLDLSVMVDVVGMGVRVVWNKGGWIHIHVSRIWTTWNHGGLCGKYDDDPTNDLKTPDNQNGVTNLVDYYRFDTSCKGSTELKEVNLIPQQNSCDILYSNVFKTCRFLKPTVKEYYNRCLIDANLLRSFPENLRFNYYCQTLSAYAQECNDVGVPVQWRTNEICPYSCKPNKAYYSCETPCPKDTCEKTVDCPDRVCSEACNVPPCPNDTIYKDSSYMQCVPKDECSATNVPTVEGQCVGDPHCTTFDGKYYDFMGKCMYYLVRGNGFDIICDNYIWNGAYVKDFKSSAPSSCAKVIIKYRGYSIELEQKLNVKVDGEKLDWLPYINPDFSVTQISSEQISVSLRNSVVVLWNGNSWVIVRIPVTMIGKVKGLLGTFTKNKDDDFEMPDGTITTDPDHFGHSWKVPDSCEDEHTGPVYNPCSIYPQKEAKAESDCSALKSNLFADCIDNVDQVYENCKYDVCQCTNEQSRCVCEFYASQADRCAAKGKYVDWRRNITECSIKCPADQTYQVCGNSCTRSCEDIAANPTCQRQCVDGCNCPEGQTLNSKNQCVAISRCPCKFENERYPPGFIFINGDDKWTCTDGKWDITPPTPDDKTKYPSIDELKKKCDANNFLVYTGCKQNNVVTCQNKHLNQRPNYENCESGCQCMDGYVLDTITNRCVKPENCPCLYKGISYQDKSERTERGKSCVCQNGAWTCTTSTDHWEMCSVWSRVHVRTFDELIYSFKGNCEYTLIEHTFGTNGVFRVTLKTVDCNGESCIKNVHIYHKDTKGNEDNVIFTTGEVFVPPKQLANLVITDLDLSIMVDVVGLGVRVVWNKGGWVHIHVARVWTTLNHVGLCGKYDDNPGNDLQTPNNQNGVSTLVDYYRVDKTCLGSTKLPDVDLLVPEKTCDILYTEVFKTCRLLKPVDEYYRRCLIDANIQLLKPESQRLNYYCETLSAYAQECNEVNQAVIWRTNEICPYGCKPNTVYYPCETPCPKETCENKVQCPDKVCSEACNVPPCPVNKIYKDSTYKQCVTRQECTSVDVPTVEGYCVADPHCVTFDGKYFDFMGKCTYYLVRGDGFDVMCDHYIWKNGAFVKDVKSTAASYCARVIIDTKTDIIELEQKHVVKVNGRRLDWFPYNSPGFRIAHPSSELTTVSLNNHVTISWNGNSRAGVSIPITMIGKVNGLLGTFTKNQEDDFQMPDGRITKDPTEFGNSWKVPGSCEDEHTGPVEHPCSVNPERKAKAEEACAPLKSDLFKSCLENVDIEYENCLYDACQCTDEQKTCVCDFYSVQSDKCAAKGINIDWRKQITQCAIQCPAGQTYQVCGNPCTRSCEDIATSLTCKRVCVDGCNCPVGQTLNSNGQCIPISRCPCIFENERYPAGFTFINGDEKWVCTNAMWNITTPTTDDKTKYPTIDELKKKCSADDFLTYSGCKRTNVVTCQNKHLNERPNYENCQSGCQCMDGYVYDTEEKSCVKPENCPCIYKGISFPDKTERSERNQKCTCRGGSWVCAPDTDRWEKCSVWSNVHVRTFDELIYSFRGNCEYVLFENSFGTTPTRLRVTLTTEKCNVGSCIKNVNVYHRDEKGNLDTVIFTTGEEFVPPKQLNNLVITNMELSVMVDVVGMGVRIVWNKLGWVHIHVARVWTTRNHIGLCGKYDDNPNNDLDTPTNGNTVPQFVDYNRVVDKNCPGSTELKEVTLILIDNYCDILYSEKFKTCRLLKPAEKYYNRCLIDANLQLLIPESQRFNYYCQTLSAYAQECNDVKQPVKWRTDKICPYQCHQDKQYYSCDTPCPIETCQKTVKCPDKVCAEACNTKSCPANMIYKDNTYKECISKYECDRTNNCNTGCLCHSGNDEKPTTIDFVDGCKEGKCQLSQLIFNIYMAANKK